MGCVVTELHIVLMDLGLDFGPIKCKEKQLLGAFLGVRRQSSSFSLPDHG